MDLILGRKAVPVLRGDELVANPHRELAALTFDELRLDAQLACQERGRTGRAGPIVSNLAVANANGCHAADYRLINGDVERQTAPRPGTQRTSLGNARASPNLLVLQRQ